METDSGCGIAHGVRNKLDCGQREIEKLKEFLTGS